MFKLAIGVVIGSLLAAAAFANSKTEIWSEGVAERMGVKPHFTAPAGFEHLSGVLYLDDKFVVVPPGLGSDKDITLLGLSFGMAVAGAPDNKTAGPTEGRCHGDGKSVETAIEMEHLPALLGDIALAVDCAFERKAGQAWDMVQLIHDDDTYLMVVTFDETDPDSAVYVDLTDWAEANS